MKFKRVSTFQRMIRLAQCVLLGLMPTRRIAKLTLSFVLAVDGVCVVCKARRRGKKEWPWLLLPTVTASPQPFVTCKYRVLALLPITDTPLSHGLCNGAGAGVPPRPTARPALGCFWAPALLYARSDWPGAAVIPLAATLD